MLEKVARLGKNKSIFFNHINLKDIEFFHWKHAELLQNEHISIQTALLEIANGKRYKSVKKAIFRNYVHQMTTTKKFNPLLTYLATTKIHDPNYIVELINMEHINNDKFLTHLDRDMLFEFTDFLTKNYNQRQVVHFFNHFESYIRLNKRNLKHSYLVFEDILRQFNFIKFDISNEYEGVRCTPKGIHDQFSKILNAKKYKHLMERKFTYSDRELSAQMRMDIYDVKLPFNGAELYSWADDLQNCLASYISSIEHKLTAVYAFFKDEKIEFAVEIRENQIVQAYRSYNRVLLPNQQNILNQWHKYFQ